MASQDDTTNDRDFDNAMEDQGVNSNDIRDQDRDNLRQDLTADDDTM